jgi:hypothetical protein
MDDHSLKGLKALVNVTAPVIFPWALMILYPDRIFFLSIAIWRLKY